MENIHGGDIYKYGGITGITDFSANINPLGMPGAVKKAIIDNIQYAIYYPDTYCEELRRCLAEYYKSYNISMDNIICGNGAASLVYRFVFADRPEKALVLAPCFSEYEGALDASGADVTRYNLDTETFCPDAGILRLVEETEDIRMVCLCNPDNPTGIMADNIFLDSLCRICTKKGIKILLDECFLDFVIDGDKSTMLQKIHNYPGLFILKAFTKMYAMPGLRLGYGICSDKEIIEKMYKAGAPWDVSVLAQKAGIAALGEEEFVIQSREYINNEKEYLYKEFDRMGITYWKGSANFIMFKSRTDLKEIMLKKKILVRDCSNFYNLSKGYYRIAVRLHNENQMLINALRSFL